MSLFKRTAAEDEVIHCPVCGERVPEGATDCAMCGHAFDATKRPVGGRFERSSEESSGRRA